MTAVCTWRTLLAPLALVAIGSAAAGCGNGTGNDAFECRASLLPGDIVISEVLANPLGQSAGKEWFEIYNATAEPVDLEGAVLVNGAGSDASRHVMGALVLESGAYAVLGGVLPEFMADYHDYGYGDDLGSLPNGGGDLAIECGDETVDSVTYPGMSSGVSMGIDGGITPDHIVNNDPDNWCEAVQTFGTDGSRGTPGRANDACGSVLQETCNDNGSERELIRPREGDLVISEIMARTTSEVEFRDGEWFEVHVARDVDLNGLQLGRYVPDVEGEDDPGAQVVGQTLASADCLHYEAGSHVVFARSDDPELNGGIPHVDYEFSLDRGLGLRTADGGIYLGYQGDVLEYVTWANPWRSNCDSTLNHCGVSLSLDPQHLTPEGSSNPDNWCFSSDEFSPSGRGTPGLSNASCVSNGPCVDESGNMRDAVSPEPGDLVITEVMANPQVGISNTEGEWFEVFVKRDVDLNGLQLGRFRHNKDEPEDVAQALAYRACLRHEADSYVLFARSDDPEHNSGLSDVDYILNLGFSTLTNSNGGVYLSLDFDFEELLEVVTWASFNHKGISRSLDPGARTPEGSSDQGNWCQADQDSEPYFCCLLNENNECDDDGTEGEACSVGTPADDNPSCD